MADENITIGVDLKDDFTGPARRVVKSIDDMGDSARASRPEWDLLEGGIEGVGEESTKTSVKARLAAKRLREMGNEALKTAGKLKVLSAVTSRLDRLNRDMTVPGGGGRGKKDSTGKIVKAGFQFRGLRLAGIIAAIASIIPAAVAGISSLAAAVAGLVGALAPLTGLIVAYPGYLATFGQAFAAVKLAFSGIGEALKTSLDPAATIQEVRTARNAFSDLGKEFSTQFVKNIAVAKREIDGMKGAIQAGLLPAVNNLVNAGRTLFPTISSGLAATGAALGNVINQFASQISAGAFTQELSQIMSNNVQIISSFGQAALSGFRALMDILVAAGPLLTQIASDIANVFQSFSNGIATSAAGGGLADFFRQTYDVARQVIQIIWDVGVALKNIVEIGKPLGDAILNSFSAMAEAMRGFTESGEGVNQIRQWFIDMTPVIYEIGYLIRDVVQALFGLSNPTQFLQISMMLRQEMLPVLVNVIEHASQIVPAILEIATAALQMINAFQQMAPLETILSGFATILSLIAKGITALASALGPVGTAILFLIGSAAGVRILAGAFMMLFRVVVGGAIYSAITGLVTAIRTFGIASAQASIAVRALGVAIRSALIATVIGAVLVGIGLIVEAIFNMNSAIDDQIGSNQAWAQSLFDVNGALSETGRASTANAIANKDYIETLEGMGISTADVTDAIMGSQTAYDSLIAKLKAVAEAEATVTIGRAGARKTYSDFGNTILGVIDDLGGMRNAYLDAESAAGRVAATVGGETAPAMDELALATQAATTSLQRLKGMLELKSESASWRQSIMDLESGIKEGLESGELSFKRFTEEGEKNLALLRGAVEATLDKVTTLFEGGNVEGARRVLDKRINYLKDIMELVPPEMRKPFQQMINDLQRQRNRFDRQVRAMMKHPIKAEVPVEMKMKADIRTPSTGDIPQSVLQGLPDISSGQSSTIEVDTSQVDAASVKVDDLNTKVSSIGTQSIVINVTGLIGLQSADTVASRLSSTLQTMPKTVNINVPVMSIQTAITLADQLRRTVMEIPGNVPISVDQSQLNSAYTTANNLYNRLQNMPRDITVTITVNVTGDEIPAGAGAMGGPVPARTPWLIGELGPEMFVSNSGMTRMIGMHGPEVMNFPTSGTIIPNHLLPEKEAANAIAGEVRTTPSRSSEYMSNSGGGYSINIGTINAQSEIDVVRAVKKGIAEAERNRRERS